MYALDPARRLAALQLRPARHRWRYLLVHSRVFAESI